MRSLLYTLREIDTFSGRVAFLRVWVRWVFWSLLRRLSSVRVTFALWCVVVGSVLLGFFRLLSRLQLGAGVLQIVLGLVFVGLVRGAAWLAS